MLFLFILLFFYGRGVQGIATLLVDYDIMRQPLWGGQPTLLDSSTFHNNLVLENGTSLFPISIPLSQQLGFYIDTLFPTRIALENGSTCVVSDRFAVLDIEQNRIYLSNCVDYAWSSSSSSIQKNWTFIPIPSGPFPAYTLKVQDPRAIRRLVIAAGSSTVAIQSLITSSPTPTPTLPGRIGEEKEEEENWKGRVFSGPLWSIEHYRSFSSFGVEPLPYCNGAIFPVISILQVDAFSIPTSDSVLELWIYPANTTQRALILDIPPLWVDIAQFDTALILFQGHVVLQDVFSSPSLYPTHVMMWWTHNYTTLDVFIDGQLHGRTKLALFSKEGKEEMAKILLLATRWTGVLFWMAIHETITPISLDSEMDVALALYEAGPYEDTCVYQ